MAEPEPQQLRRMSANNQTISKTEIPLKERFFRYFQHEITGMYELDLSSPATGSQQLILSM